MNDLRRSRVRLRFRPKNNLAFYTGIVQFQTEIEHAWRPLKVALSAASALDSFNVANRTFLGWWPGSVATARNKQSTCLPSGNDELIWEGVGIRE
jgi:hypothetical protein